MAHYKLKPISEHQDTIHIPTTTYQRHTTTTMTPSATMNRTPTPDPSFPEPPTRAALRMARRVLIKAGTSVVANDDGSPSLTRLGAIVEQIAELNHAGVEVMFVSSGAVGMGKNLLRKQARLNMSFKDLHNSSSSNPGGNVHPVITKEGQSVGGIVGLTPNTSISNLLAVNEHSTYNKYNE